MLNGPPGEYDRKVEFLEQEMRTTDLRELAGEHYQGWKECKSRKTYFRANKSINTTTDYKRTMPKVKISDQEFQKLFLDVRNKTKNFSEIKPELISTNPYYIRVFRMLCCKSLTEMGNLLNKTHATIAQYERRAIKSIPLTEAVKIAHLIREEIPQEKSLEHALSSLQRFRELANGGYVQAFKSAEKSELTKQEKLVREVLENKKIKYEPHKTLNTSIGELNFDFWLPEKKIVIECTESVSKHKAEALGFRAIKLKDKMQCRMIAIIPSNVSNGVIRRLSDYDKIIFSTDLSKLENIVK